MQSNLWKTKSVYIDPNKRDLLFCLGSNNENFRYTSMMRRKDLKISKGSAKKISDFEKKKILENGNLKLYKKTTCLLAFESYLLNYFGIRFEEDLKFYWEKIFRRNKFWNYRNTQISESKMMNNFQEKFGTPEETTVFLGDWSTGGYTPKGQVPSKSKGFRKIFKKYGYDIYLVQESYTSKICPICWADLEKKFKRRYNPNLGELICNMFMVSYVAKT
jgi:hypothetical protein